MFASSAFRHALRDAAPNLSRRFFTCQASSASTRTLQSSATLKASFQRQRQSISERQLRSFSSTCLRSFRRSARLREALVQNIENTTTKSKGGSRFPETSSNAVAYWLLASAASVFGIVVFGGLTRLTESGYVNICLYQSWDVILT